MTLLRRKKQRASVVEFLHPWNGRQVGDVDHRIDYGACVELVRKGIARWSTRNATFRCGGESHPGLVK